MPNAQFAKAAIISSHLPPAAKQANKYGINHYVVIQGKDKTTPKEESKHTGKLINSNAEQSPISDSERKMPSGKPLSMFEMTNANTNHGSVCARNTDMSKILPRKSGKSSRASRNHTCLDASQKNSKVLNVEERIEPNVNMLSPNASNDNTGCNIKVERGIKETFSLEKQEVPQYFDDNSISSRNEMHNRCPLKRKCSDQDLLTMPNNKRLTNDMYTSNANRHNEQNISYLKCKSFARHSTTFSNGINQCNSQLMAKSPNSNLHEGSDYQLGPTMIITNHDKGHILEDTTNPGKL